MKTKHNSSLYALRFYAMLMCVYAGAIHRKWWRWWWCWYSGVFAGFWLLCIAIDLLVLTMFSVRSEYSTKQNIQRIYMYCLKHAHSLNTEGVSKQTRNLLFGHGSGNDRINYRQKRVSCFVKWVRTINRPKTKRWNKEPNSSFNINNSIDSGNKRAHQLYAKRLLYFEYIAQPYILYICVYFYDITNVLTAVQYIIIYLCVLF